MTSEAPKEIFVNWPQENGTGLAFSKPTDHRHSYTLTTHAQAMVAAERDACAAMCDTKDFWDFREKAAALHIAKAIRARTPDDAQAALDALLRAERVKALREAADCIGHITQAEDRDAILALIEKETGHE